MARKEPKIYTYDVIVRGTNDYIPVKIQRQDSLTGQITPRDLTGMIAILTVKPKQYDGVRPTLTGKPTKDDQLIADWHAELSDESSSLTDMTGWERDALWRITVDCDDPSEGLEGPKGDYTPQLIASQPVWSNNYQGMYGKDPKEGEVIFRLSKKMTMVRPGTYFADVRLMEKRKSAIGEIVECRDWMPVMFEIPIVGSPTNRTQFDWEQES